MKRWATTAFGLNSVPVFVIKSTRDDPDKVDRLIAEFPGPLCLQASSFKWWPVIATGPAIAALCAFTVISSDLRHGSPLNGSGVFIIIVGLFVGLFIVAFGRRGLMGSFRLDVDGFRAISAMQKQYRWSDVKDFSPYGFKSGGQVVFDTKTERHDAGAAYWSGANTPPLGKTLSTSETKSFSGVSYKSMPDNYGLAADDLARLMNSWRQLAIETSVRT